MVVQLQWQQTFKERQTTSQLRSLSGLIFPSCVLSYTGSTLLNNTFHIFDSTSFGRDDGFQERSDVALLQLFFGLSFVPHHISEFLAMDTPITRFSFDQFTCTLSKRLRLPHHIHQLFLRSADVLNSARHQIAASAAVGTRLCGRMTRDQHCAAKLWTSALRERKAAAEHLGHVSRLTKNSGPDVNGQRRIW